MANDNGGFVGRPGSGLTDAERMEVSWFKARRIKRMRQYENSLRAKPQPVPARPDRP